MTVEAFAQIEEHLLALIHDKLMSGNYRFQPARRVLIPNEGTSKKRKLGYCRWADDGVIVVRSERAAQRVMQGTIAYLHDFTIVFSPA